MITTSREGRGLRRLDGFARCLRLTNLSKLLAAPTVHASADGPPPPSYTASKIASAEAEYGTAGGGSTPPLSDMDMVLVIQGEVLKHAHEEVRGGRLALVDEVEHRG